MRNESKHQILCHQRNLVHGSKYGNSQGKELGSNMCRMQANLCVIVFLLTKMGMIYAKCGSPIVSSLLFYVVVVVFLKKNVSTCFDVR